MSALPDLEAMDRAPLLALWTATLGGEPPPRLSQPFLRRMLAWELQAREKGGLPAALRKKLETLAAAQGKGQQKITTPRMKPGGRFLREWNGVTHVVDVVEGAFLWRGERHRSLSAIARAITGAHWSGPRFFGLQEGGATAKAIAAGKRTQKSANAGAATRASVGTKRRTSPPAPPPAPRQQAAAKATWASGTSQPETDEVAA